MQEAARKEAEEKEEAERAKKAAEEKKRKEEEEAAAAAAAAAARAEEERIREERRNRPVTCSIVGPPGSIKGKVCELIVAEFGCKHVSLGEATRHAVQHETEAGRKVKEAKKEGQTIPDEISIECIVELALSEDLSKKGYILDGIPRSTEQASAIADSGIAMKHLLIVEISDDELVRRAVGRRMDLETHTLYHLEGLGFPMPPDDDAVLARLTQVKIPPSQANCWLRHYWFSKGWIRGPAVPFLALIGTAHHLDAFLSDSFALHPQKAPENPFPRLQRRDDTSDRVLARLDQVSLESRIYSFGFRV